MLQAALGTLSDDQRSALQLRVVDELSYREVAEQLGATEQTVRARVSRGLRALADALEPDSSPGGEHAMNQRFRALRDLGEQFEHAASAEATNPGVTPTRALDD